MVKYYIMEEKIVTKQEIIDLFEKRILVDSGKGWFYKIDNRNLEVDIMAIHEVEPKYLTDMYRAENYKIKFK